MTPTVTVYTKPGCAQCVATERRLTEKGIPFAFANATDPANTDRIKDLGHLQAPVVTVVSAEKPQFEHWSGFRPDLIDELAKRIGAAA